MPHNCFSIHLVTLSNKNLTFIKQKNYLLDKNIDCLSRKGLIRIFCRTRSLKSYLLKHTHYIPFHSMCSSLFLSLKSTLLYCHISCMLSNLYTLNTPQLYKTHIVLSSCSKNTVQCYRTINTCTVRNIEGNYQFNTIGKIFL